MYGYNLSANPSVLLHNELVPAAKLNAGVVGEMYLYSLCRQLDCGGKELWVDLGRGVFCRGPSGPHTPLGVWAFGEEELPLTAELVKEDVLLHFLASLKSKQVDDVVVRGVVSSGAWIDVPERVLRPTVILRLTNTPIAVANNVWESMEDSLSDQKVLENGMTRFTLAGGGYLRLEWNWDADRAWMTQAWSVFSARGISLDEDLGVYKLVYPRAELSGWLSYSEARQQSQQPVYLFVRPPPLGLRGADTSSLHFWSFDEDGHSPLSEDLCHDFGLPTELGLFQDFYSYSWSNDAYSHLRQYQVLRGFDLSTTDFAQFLEFDENIYLPLSDSDRFARVNQEPSLDVGASPSIANISALENPITTHPTRLPHGLEPTTADFVRHTGVGEHVFQPANDLNQSEQESECKPPTSTASKTTTAGAHSAGFLSALLSPLSSTLSDDSDILTISF
ncbi:hypothetical protein PM082_021673 [Marasmius tenuissimus]|nr:hypothetical protein PM082_021673 [Marasmius tenuissimus]